MRMFWHRFILAGAFLPTLFSQSFTVATIAGTTRFVPGAAATSTPLRRPVGVAQDSAGNIFIADSDDNRVFAVGVDGKDHAHCGHWAGGLLGR